tara:strand:+ start:93 stop:308 length:216 start_codon:yes stop_codon:yes gene_type:complete
LIYFKYLNNNIVKKGANCPLFYIDCQLKKIDFYAAAAAPTTSPVCTKSEVELPPAADFSSSSLYVPLYLRA